MLSLMKPGAAATVTGLLVFTTTGADTAHQSRISPAAQEVHLRNIRQLTFEGENAEAYFSFDGTRLIFQSTPRAGGCDQIYTMSLDGGDVELLSTGQGRTTCSYYYPAGDKILYSSTHHFDTACPAVPDFSRGYVWAVYPASTSSWRTPTARTSSN